MSRPLPSEDRTFFSFVATFVSVGAFLFATLGLIVVSTYDPGSTATSAQAFGGMDALVAAANKEGALNVIALPPDWANYGEVIKAFVVRRPQSSLQEQQIKRHCLERLAAYKVPRFIEFVAHLPRTPSGKVQRSLLQNPQEIS